MCLLLSRLKIRASYPFYLTVVDVYKLIHNKLGGTICTTKSIAFLLSITSKGGGKSSLIKIDAL